MIGGPAVGYYASNLGFGRCIERLNQSDSEVRQGFRMNDEGILGRIAKPHSYWYHNFLIVPFYRCLSRCQRGDQAPVGLPSRDEIGAPFELSSLQRI